jgi:hypothetical protein
VFPAVDVPKAVQVLMGLYPIAQVAEPFSAIQFIAERVAVEDFYKLKPDPDHLSSVSEDSDDDGNRKRRNKKGNSQSKKAAAIAKCVESIAISIVEFRFFTGFCTLIFFFFFQLSVVQL